MTVLDPGRSAETWVDWNLAGNQPVTHLSPDQDGHDVPVPHFGVILAVLEFQKIADRLRTAEVDTGEQWTGFLLDGPTRPAGDAMEFKAFADDSQVFARRPHPHVEPRRNNHACRDRRWPRKDRPHPRADAVPAR